MAWVPSESVAVVKSAAPAMREVVPNGVVPSMNVTVPVGVPAPGATAFTVTVKVTGWPSLEFFGEALIAIVVSA